MNNTSGESTPKFIGRRMMYMKKILLVLVGLAFLVSSPFLVSCKKQEPAKKTTGGYGEKAKETVSGYGEMAEDAAEKAKETAAGYGEEAAEKAKEAVPGYGK
jgi:predicted lipid-binding transport protein (Tim44 family)